MSKTKKKYKKTKKEELKQRTRTRKKKTMMMLKKKEKGRMKTKPSRGEDRGPRETRKRSQQRQTGLPREKTRNTKVLEHFLTNTPRTFANVHRQASISHIFASLNNIENHSVTRNKHTETRIDVHEGFSIPAQTL